MDYRSKLVELGTQPIDSGKYWRITATYRGGKNPLSISVNNQTGKFQDFGNNQYGSFKQLIELLGGTATETYAPDVEVVEKFKPEKTYPIEILKKLVPNYSFFLNRGISAKTLELFQAGFAQGGKLRWRICFPVFNRLGKIFGFAGRWYKNEVTGATPKWKLIGRKTDFIYPAHLNESILKETKKVIIVESVGDVLSLWDAGIKNVLCVFGTDISFHQICYLIHIDCEEIILATNNEPDNKEIGNRAAEKMKNKLRKYFSDDKIIIHLPFEKDFGTMNKNQILQWYQSYEQR